MSEDGNNPNGERLRALMETQLESQGVGCIAVKDGHVFMFSSATLQHLLDQANRSPEKRALVFIKTGPKAGLAVV